jgi:Niemann-Pick C1 protein
MTCSPEQDQFLIVTKERDYNPSKDAKPNSNVVPADNHDDEHDRKRSVSSAAQLEITEITYTISEYYVNRFFDSCKDVKYTAANQRALDILCSDSQCTPVKLVTFLGNNKYAPFVFNVNVTDQDFDFNQTVHIVPRNSTVYSCSAAINSTYYKANPCGCSDCKSMCPAPPKPDNHEVCYISGVECFTFGIFVSYIALLVVFIFTFILYRKKANHAKSIVQVTSGKFMICPVKP